MTNVAANNARAGAKIASNRRQLAKLRATEERLKELDPPPGSENRAKKERLLAAIKEKKESLTKQNKLLRQLRASDDAYTRNQLMKQYREERDRYRDTSAFPEGAVSCSSVTCEAKTSVKKLEKAEERREREERIQTVELIEIRYLYDHAAILDKRDNWRDPVTLQERLRIKSKGAEWIRGARPRNEAWPVSYTMETRIGLSVKLRAKPEDARSETGARLRGKSRLPHLSFQDWFGTLSPGEFTVYLDADEPLPRKIDLIDAEPITWTVRTDDVPKRQVGRSKHEVYVTAGPPTAAQSWPLTNNSSLPGDHNFFTAFRMKHAVRKAKGGVAPPKGFHRAVHRLWRSYGQEFDLGAAPHLHPWRLTTGARAQCHTIASYLESMAGLLGLPGEVIYVWPRFTEPPVDPAHKWSRPRGWVAEAPGGSDLDYRVVSLPLHAGRMWHGNTQPEEKSQMVDGGGGLNNFEATFRYQDPTTTLHTPPTPDPAKVRYYGGGGPVTKTPVGMMKEVCDFLAWVYSAPPPPSNPAGPERDRICNNPGPKHSWI